MKKIIIIALVLLVHLDANSQSECGTPAPPNWIFNPTMQSLQLGQDIRIINIFIHIVRGSSGNGLSSGITTTITSILNSAYEDTNIQFNLTGYEFINNDYYYVDISSSAKQNQLLSLNAHSNAIDIYVLGTSTQTGGFAGRAADIPSISLIVGGSYYNTSTLPHEMGHCLGLYHTHHAGTIIHAKEGFLNLLMAVILLHVVIILLTLLLILISGLVVHVLMLAHKKMQMVNLIILIHQI